MSQDRRSFLKRSGAALSAVAVGGAVPDAAAQPASDETRDAAAGSIGQRASLPRLDPALLGAVASVVLPDELGDAGRREAVADFIAWAEAYEPVAEMNHGYGTSEIRYGPPDPKPAWVAQLEALELEAGRRHGSSFVDLSAADRRALIELQELDGGAGLPNPLRAGHVAVALMAHWFGSPAAVDRAYGRRIAERSCARGIDSAPLEPEAL